MNLLVRLLITIQVICTGLISSAVSLADSNAKPAAAVFYPMIGKWHGQGEMVEPGQVPAKLTLTLSCKKVSAGWAVACTMSAKNKTMSIIESDLMGVDPVTGKGHWYAITNTGETHDHLVDWKNADTMHAQFIWIQDGKQMMEDITFNFKKRAMTFHSVVTADGQIAGEFSGSVKR